MSLSRCSELGWRRIGRIDAAGKRSLWIREEHNSIELCAGRAGDDAYVRITSDDPQGVALSDVLTRARWAAELEDEDGRTLERENKDAHFAWEDEDGRPLEERDRRQAEVFAWVQAAFTREQARSLPQRGLRLLEEAIEAFQAVGGDPGFAHRLVDYVYSRPVGDLTQELGGVSIGILALAAAAGVSADEAERVEAERVLAKPLEYFRKRNEVKSAAGFLCIECEDNQQPLLPRVK